MSDSQIEDIKSKVDIVSIIGEHVQLTKSGSNFKGLCPFHQEKTPSFMVSPELQIYKCFGCGEGGDVFTFLEKYEGMEFSEALKFLAEKTGVKLESFTNIQTSEKDILYEINSLAAKFYNFLLTSHPIGKLAINYLKEERKINLDSIKTFNIGFAPAGKNVLSDFLIKKKKYKVKDLERGGLVYISRSGRIFDRFEGRVIFPISDHRGNVIALAGRQLPPGNPKSGKYINSPETEIYHKSSSLFGINTTKDFVKKEGFAVIVEGELDLISSFQVGIRNAVAIKGSAVTEDQARLLSRYAKEIVLALDSDFAGVAASIRGIKILENTGFEVRVAKLGIYKDPDEAAKKNPEFLKEKIKSAIPVWDFIIDSIVEKYDKNSAQGKRKISNELNPILVEIPNKIIQEHYIHKLAKLLEVSDESVTEEIEKVGKKTKTNENLQHTSYNIQHTNVTKLREEKLIALILKTKPELLKDKKIKDLIKTPILKRLIEEFDPNNPSGKNFPRELFDKYAKLTLQDSDFEPNPAKAEINNLYKFLNLDLYKEKYKNAIDKKESFYFQQKYKEFDSDKFERIIE